MPLITNFRWLPDGRLAMIGKNGGVYVRLASGGPPILAGSFDVNTEGEKGLLGLAVHPDFATNGNLFFYSSRKDAAGGTDSDRHRVVKRVLDANNQLGPETLILSRLRGPNHIAGSLDIGPDGLLYVAVGDNGCNGGFPAEPPYTPFNFYPTCLTDDPMGNGGGNGKILRVAPDGSIPPSNPLVGAGDVTACAATCDVAISPLSIGAPRTDIYAWGFRNPWRIWVDPVTGLLWVGDVGEISYEEITIVQPGRHHGWPWREADHGHPVSACRQVQVGTDSAGSPIMDGDCVDPVYRCRHAIVDDPQADPGCVSVTGGQIVDSCQWPDAFRGKYFFADNSNGSVWMLTPNAARDGIVGPRQEFATIDGGPVTLRSGNDGALYIASLGGGRIARIAPRTPLPCGTSTTLTPPESTTTTTLTPPSGSTSTTVAPPPGSTSTTLAPPVGSTTSTTLPAGPCAGLAGLALAQCQLDGIRDAALCDQGLPAKIEKILRRSLERSRDFLVKAASNTRPRVVRKGIRRAGHALVLMSRLASRQARRGKITLECQSGIIGRVGNIGEILTPLARRR